jgi:hypothetical protein
VIDPGAARAATAERVMERLSGFAQGSGVSGRVACQIIEWVIASPTDRRRRRPVGKARTCILIAPGKQGRRRNPSRLVAASLGGIILTGQDPNI